MNIFFDSSVYFFTFLKTKKKYIHRGEILAAAVKKRSIRIVNLAKRMGISRGTYYNHIEDPDLSLDLLEQYGKVLNYDFTEDVTGMQKYSTDDPVEPYNEPKNMEEAIRQRDYWRKKSDHWKDKYIELLEEMKQG